MKLKYVAFESCFRFHDFSLRRYILDSMFAVGWIPTRVPGRHMRDCPNINGKGYNDDDK